MKLPIRVTLLARYLLHDTINVVLCSCAILALATWLLSKLIWVPVVREHADITVELRDRSEHYRQQTAREDTRRAVDEALQRLEDWDERLNQHVDQVALMTQIADMAFVSDLTILGQTYDESEYDSGLSALRQEISFQGQYVSLRSFLFTLPALPGITRVEELSVERSTGKVGSVRGRLRLINYRKVESTQ